jgi:hypothetical protein
LTLEYKFFDGSNRIPNSPKPFLRSFRPEAFIGGADRINVGQTTLKIDLLIEEELVLVTTNPEARLLDDKDDNKDYAHMDWGPGFCASPWH